MSTESCSNQSDDISKYSDKSVNDALVRHDYEGDMERRLKEIGHKLDEILSKTDKKTTETLDLIKTKKEDASLKLSQMKGTSKEAWDELKIGLDHAWEDLNIAWSELSTASEKAAAKFSK